MMTTLFRKCLHITILFAYLNSMFVMAYAGNPKDWEPTDYTIKVKWAQAPGVGHDNNQAPSTEDGLRFVVKSKGLNLNQTPTPLVDTFIPLNNPLSRGNKHLFTEMMVDGPEGPESLSLGVQWTNPLLPHMTVLILWDGSILVKGQPQAHRQDQSLRISSPALIDLHDVQYREAQLKAQNVVFENNNQFDTTRIHLRQQQGQAIIAHDSLLTTSLFKQTQGQFIQGGDIQGINDRPLTMTVPYLELGEGRTISAHSVHLTVDDGELKGVLEAEAEVSLQVNNTVHLREQFAVDAPLWRVQGSGKIANHQDLTVQQLLFDQFMGTLFNLQSLTAQQTITGDCGELINVGTMTAQQGYNVRINKLLNQGQGTLKGHGQITIGKGQNLGVMGDVHAQFVVNNALHNTGTLTMSGIKGAGQLNNQGLINGEGTETQPVTFAITQLHNSTRQGVAQSGHINIKHLIFKSAVKEWQMPSGVITADHVTLAPDSGMSLEFQGGIEAKKLTLDFYRLINSGHITVDDLVTRPAARYLYNREQGSILVHNRAELNFEEATNRGLLIVGGELSGKLATLQSSGSMVIKGRTALDKNTQTTFINDGDAVFEDKAAFHKVTNNKTLVAQQGLAVDTLDNQGTMDVKGKLNYQSSLNNTGTLSIIEGVLKSPQKSLENHGHLNLIRSNASGQLTQLKNHNFLSIEDYNSKFRILINHGEAIVSKGSHLFDTLVNYKTLRLLGHHWNIQDRFIPLKYKFAPKRSYIASREYDGINNVTTIYVDDRAFRERNIFDLEHKIIAKEFNNQGEILVERTVTYDHSGAHGLIKADKNIYLPKPDQDLVPEDFTGLEAGKKIEAAGQDFKITKDTILDIPLLILHLQHFEPQAHLTIGGLQMIIKDAFVGGQDKDHLIKIKTTQNELSIRANSVDARYTQFFGEGPTAVIAMEDDLQLGADDSRGAYAASLGPVRLQSLRKQLAIKNAEILGRGVFLGTSLQKGYIHILCSRIFSFGPLGIEGYKLHVTQPGFDRQPRITAGWHKFFIPITHDHYTTTALPNSLQALGHTTVDVTNTTLDFDTYLLTGLKLYSWGKLYNQLKAQDEGAFKLNTRQQYYWEDCYNKWNYNVFYGPVFAPRVMSGQGAQVMTDTLNSQGIIHAPTVDIEAKNATFHNPLGIVNVANNNLDIDMDMYATEMFKDGALIKTINGVTKLVDTMNKNAFYVSKHDVLFYEALPTDDTLDSSVHQIALEFAVQRALAQHAGTVNCDDKSGRELFAQAFKNGQEFATKHQRRVFTQADLATATHLMLVFEPRVKTWSSTTTIRNFNNLEVPFTINHSKHCLIPHLIVPKRLINPYQSPGDVSGQDVSCRTTGNQYHLSNRFVGEKKVHVSAEGQLRRETLKYVQEWNFANHHIRQEYAGPRQEIRCLEGDATIISKGDYSEIGTYSFAGRDLLRGSTHGHTNLAALILRREETKTEHSSSGGLFSKSTSTTTTNATHEHRANTGEASRHSTITAGEGKIITAIGDQNAAVQDLHLKGEYHGDALITKRETKSTSTTSSGWGATTTLSSMAQSPEVTRGLLAAARIYFYGKQATVNGTDVQALEVFNHTRQGLSFGPTIAEMLQSISSSTSSAFGRATSENKSGQEVEARPRLNIGVLHTEASPTTFTNTDWIKRPEIRGEFEEKMRVLHKWQTSTSSASGLYDPNVSAVVSLAVSIGVGYMTAGTGSLFTSFAKMGMTKGLGILGTQMAAAGARAALVGITSQAVMGLARGQTPDEVAQDLSSSQSVQSLAISMLAASALYGVNDALKIKAAPTELGDQIKKQVVKAGVEGVAGLARGQELADVMRNAAIGMGSGVAANQIGGAYKGEEASLNWFGHKAAHAALGAFVGAITAENAEQGMVAGAIGAATAEIVSETLSQQLHNMSHDTAQNIKQRNEDVTLATVKAELDHQMRINGDIGRLTASIVALMLGKDVPTAILTANNAIENNHNNHLKGFIVTEALEALFVQLPMTIELLKLYDKDGVNGAVNHLVQLKHIQQTSKGYCFNSDFYPSAQDVWHAYVAHHELIIELARPLVPLSQQTITEYLQEQYHKHINPQPTAEKTSTASSAMPPHDPDWEPEERKNNRDYTIKTENFNLQDRQYLTEDKALDAASEFLGKGYKDMGNGRFLSQDGFRQVRMGDSDLRGLHSGGRHMNFEMLKPNPAKPGKYLVDQNLHIFLK